eukprot:9801561-Lingulodinium_polyedra.AAC.1
MHITVEQLGLFNKLGLPEMLPPALGHTKNYYGLAAERIELEILCQGSINNTKLNCDPLNCFLSPIDAIMH